MAIKFVDEADLTTVGNAIRAKTGGSGLLTFPAGMAAAIAGIEAGADLPTLTNPAGAGDMASGKQSIGQDGVVVTGTLPSLADTQMELDDVVQEGTDLCLSGAAAQDGILRSGDIITVKKPLAYLGNAAATDVASGKTFTGAAGIAIAGTLPEKTADSAAVVLSTESAQLVAKTQISLANNFIKLSCPNRSVDMVLRSGAPVQILALPAAFGNATAADVAAGKTFTSAAGFKVTGTGAMAEIITRPSVVTITPDEVIVGSADRVVSYTCPDGYIPFSISTSNPNAIVELYSYDYNTRGLTYTVTWAGDTMEDVESTISLIKV